MRIHLLGDDADGPLEWPPSPADVARCIALIGSATAEAEMAEQDEFDQQERARRCEKFAV